MTPAPRRWSAWLASTIAVFALMAVDPAAASAQARRAPARPPRQPRVELGIGAGVAGGLTLGERDATLLSNNATGSPFLLFSSDTRLASSGFVEGRIGYRVSPRLTVEGLLTFARPELKASLSGDTESATAVEATETLTEYVITGGALWRFSANSRRLTPFVSGGGGVVRHVHEGDVLIETAVDGYVGGGVIYPLGGRRATTPRAGLRVDGRVHMLSGGLAEGAGISPRVALSGSVFVTF